MPATGEQAGEQERGFYDRSYADPSADLYLTIRQEAFGEDIGQNSWLTADEYRRFFARLTVDSTSHILEVASGSGGPALFMVRETGCVLTGVDLHQAGVDAATAAAAEAGLAARARFLCADTREPLPFEDAAFDVLTCIDSLNHLYERERVLNEWRRVLRPGGRMVVTDPITVTGLIRREELVLRSGSMGEFVFTAPGVDEQLLEQVGFVDIEVEDVTQNMDDVAARWHAARERHRGELDEVEGAAENAATQAFLDVVATLARERRLSRFAYFATAPS